LKTPTQQEYERTELKDWQLGKIKVFLLAGRIASGKSTVGNILAGVLQERYPQAIIKISGFAYGVKSVARDSFGWDGNKDDKGRRLLQVVGTEAGREYDNDIWAKKAYNDTVGNIMPPNIVIFDDWRFPNEYTYWLDKPEIGEIYKIRVFRDEEIISDHLSEKALPISAVVPDYYDYRFDNNGEEESIEDKVRAMVKELV